MSKHKQCEDQMMGQWSVKPDKHRPSADWKWVYEREVVGYMEGIHFTLMVLVGCIKKQPRLLSPTKKEA